MPDKAQTQEPLPFDIRVSDGADGQKSDSYWASFKYEGQLVQGGILDARAAASALQGLDRSLKFFMAQQNSTLGSIDLPIPVRVQEGSWEAFIPDVYGWLRLIGTVGSSAYVAAAFAKLAQNDVGDKGLKDVVLGAARSVQWLIRLGKHLRHLNFKSLKGLDWKEDGTVGIPNVEEKILEVPTDVFQKLLSCPPTLLAELASVVEDERSLKVTRFYSGKKVEVELTRQDRYVFYEDSAEMETVFPEMTHGMTVELEGIVTRENGRANSLGFHHEGHVLTCMPREGSVIRFKRHLFLSCKLKGEVTREDKKGEITLRRPKLIIDDLAIIPDRQVELPIEAEDEDEGSDERAGI